MTRNKLQIVPGTEKRNERKQIFTMSRGCHSFPHADDRPFLFVVRKNFFLACKQEDKLYMPRGVTLTGSYHCGIAFLIFTRTWHIEQNKKCGNGGTMLKDGNSFFFTRLVPLSQTPCHRAQNFRQRSPLSTMCIQSVTCPSFPRGISTLLAFPNAHRFTGQ